ncbi:MAG: thermonuclease family protein [Gemmatimonadetes bacterium]|nr:thermonuclease family protein [Gemmatimonadota bacterium]
MRRASLAALVLTAPGMAFSQGSAEPRRPPASDLTCVVAKLDDGDSFKCRDGRSVRLLLIDTPELAQRPWGEMARRKLDALAGPGTTLRLEFDRTTTDRYRRTLAYAWKDSVLLNEWMVANGWAVVLAYENVRHLDRLRRAERAAQGAKKGLWQAWKFRCRPVDFRARRCDF